MDLCPDTRITISEEGEVLVSTTCMMEGYWKRPQEPAAVLHDGVLSSGDLGTLDENGRLHISGRKNDVLVLSNGEKIFCPEWETELSRLIGEEIALSAPGGTLTLFAAEGTTASEVRKAVDAFNLKQPISRRILDVRVIDGKLPRTATGKIRRWKLEEFL
jgi:long-subunit acyl-CoA synthetase (AMP-forming)